MSPEPLVLRPVQLLCAICLQGGAPRNLPCRSAIARLVTAVRQAPNRPLRLVCHADGIFRYQNPQRLPAVPGGALLAEKRDMDILQRLGLVPGDTRPARDLVQRVVATFKTTRGLCDCPGATLPEWRGCPLAQSGCYEKGLAAGTGGLVPARDAADKAAVKTRSAAATRRAKRLQIRPHHLLCLCCFHRGRDSFDPIAEDNLAEVITAMQRQPTIPVTLVRGCCMICPPCSAYDPELNLCVGSNAMSLRDQKRDLDVLAALGLKYGDTLPARELWHRLFAAVTNLKQICGFGDNVVRATEWSICAAASEPDPYTLAKAHGLGIVRRR